MKKKPLLTFKQMWLSFKRKNPFFKNKENKIAYDANPEMGWNIYGDKNLKPHTDKFNRIHYIFKYKIFMPVLWLIERVIGKHLDEPIPAEPYNTNLLVFDKTFQESVDDWVELYLVNSNDERRKTKAKSITKLTNCYSVKILKLLGKIASRTMFMDSAYKEWYTIFAHKLVHNMMKEYKGKTINHVFYNAMGINDVIYHSLFLTKHGAEILKAGELNNREVLEIFDKETENEKHNT